ncbi:MAG: radical SAM protein [Acidobacteria bacterium]|nr:radical SAM protein [Acidobacteriota bacterium]
MTQFRGLLAKAARDKVPIDVSLEITHRCNYRCRHCYIPDLTAPDLLPTERILLLLEELAEIGTLFLTLTGGEPLVRRDWEVIARRARELGFMLTVLTNGSLVDEKVADTLAELMAGAEISLHSMDPETFDRATCSRGSFARTIRGIELLVARSVPVELKMPVTTLNRGHVPAVMEYANRLGVPCQAFPKIVARKDGNLQPLQLRIPEPELVDFYAGPHSGCHVDGADPPLPGEDGPLCAAARRYANITAAGEVMACNILPGSAGNLLTSTFREIWEGSAWLERIRDIRRSDLPVCSTCSKHSYCGRCLAQAMVEDGDLLGPSQAACDHAEAVERALRCGA